MSLESKDRMVRLVLSLAIKGRMVYRDLLALKEHPAIVKPYKTVILVSKAMLVQQDQLVLED